MFSFEIPYLKIDANTPELLKEIILFTREEAKMTKTVKFKVIQKNEKEHNVETSIYFKLIESENNYKKLFKVEQILNSIIEGRVHIDVSE
jgi:hypothetical protein